MKLSTDYADYADTKARGRWQQAEGGRQPDYVYWLLHLRGAPAVCSCLLFLESVESA